MSVSFDDIRVAPSGSVDWELFPCTLEAELDTPSLVHAVPHITHPSHSHTIQPTPSSPPPHPHVLNPPTNHAPVPESPPPLFYCTDPTYLIHPPLTVSNAYTEPPPPAVSIPNPLLPESELPSPIPDLQLSDVVPEDTPTPDPFINPSAANNFIQGNPQTSAFFSSYQSTGAPSRDIGDSSTDGPTPDALLEFTGQKELEQLENIIGNKEVSSAKISFAPLPGWLKDKVLDEELTGNWKDAYHVVPERTAPKTSNVIRSQLIYKVKRKERGSLKARLCARGDQGKLKKIRRIRLICRSLLHYASTFMHHFHTTPFSWRSRRHSSLYAVRNHSVRTINQTS